MYEKHPLLQALRDPQSSISFSIEEWDQCLRQARRASVLGRLSILLRERGVLNEISGKICAHMDAARAVASHYERTMRWEVNRLERALSHLETPTVLLKGAAYLIANLPPARGRLYSDVDILVPRDQLAVVERALLNAGWETMKLDAYDQRYYRTWMHELPPLRHRERATVVDVHHSILPETGRLHPECKLLLKSAIATEGTPFKVLAPADMVLHSAAHMFQDGELAGALRDLTDLDDLFRYFGSREGFWNALVPRAQQLDLSRPLFYALRYSQQLLHTPVPAEIITAAGAAGSPQAPVLHFMDVLVRRALILDPPDQASSSAELARWLLYIRSHWLRMPPLLLTRHLFRKSLRRMGLQPERPQPNQP